MKVLEITNVKLEKLLKNKNKFSLEFQNFI